MTDVPANSSKTVYYINRVTNPVYLDILGAEPDIEVHKLTNDSPDGDVEPVMAAQEDLVEIVHTLRQVVCVKG